jgi:hypothetical protein
MADPILAPQSGDTTFELDAGEKVLLEIRSDRATYWRDHGVMAVLGMVGAGVVLMLIDSPHVAIGSLGAVLALIVRGLWLYSEQMKFLWVLTNIRLVGPGGRSIYLLELDKIRRLFGDIQIITKTGDKFLVKHVAGSEAVVTQINAARDKRAKRKGA